MFNLGDEIIYENIKGVVVDLDNQIIFNGNNKYAIIFSKSRFVESVFDDLDDLDLYLSFVHRIEGDIIDIR